MDPATIALAVFAATLAQAPPKSTETHVILRPVEGRWDAKLVGVGGEIPFELDVQREGDRWRATIVDGDEQIEVPEVAASMDELRLGFPHYDSSILAHRGAVGEFTGLWRRRRDATHWTELPFTASPIEVAKKKREVKPYFDLSGRWAVKFSSSSDPAVALFAQDGVDLRGTILTTTGDYRYLSGTDLDAQIAFSTFDGAHAFVFTAKYVRKGELSGEFFSGDSWHETWTAKLDPQAELPDPFGLTHADASVRLADLKFPDVDGQVHSLDDPGLAGCARVIQVFGTWCPNCNDEAPFLVELDRRFRDRGLRVIGLAFELTGEASRDARQVQRFAERYGVRYPLLVAGVSDKDRASKSFPLLDRVRAYPTTIFVRRDGSVRAVHQGYAGPATGAAHAKLRDDFERLIDELLADGEKR